MHVHDRRASWLTLKNPRMVNGLTNSLYIASVYETGKPPRTSAIASYEQLLSSID